MTYLREFAVSWQAFAAACLGLIAGTSSIYLNNVFSPHLIGEFGWSKSEFALIGSTVIISVFALPIVGRLTDRHGMRKIVTVGIASLPAIFVGLALQQGSFILFFSLSLLQMLVVSALAGFVVYSRLVVRSFTRARGLALGLASSAAPLATVILAPLLSAFVEQYGWRTGYFAMGAGSAVLGVVALLLIPRSYHDVDEQPAIPRNAVHDYRSLLRNRAFLVIFVALLLCNLHFTIQTTQLKLIMEENGIGSSAGSMMISVFAIGVILGRLACGLALDRFAPRLVATACFLVPSMGLAILASGSPNIVLVALAVTSLGFTVGAEGDIAAFLAAAYFRSDLFSSVLGLFAAAMAASAFVGAFLLSWMVDLTGGYAAFLKFTSVTMLVGSLSFLLLRPSSASAT